MKHLLLCGLVFFMAFSAGTSAWAQDRDWNYQGSADWREFQQYVKKQTEDEEKLGLGYMISGTLATVGGTLGYYQSQEIFSRTVFAITSNVGLAAIGLGATYYWTSSQANSFFYAVDGSSLSLAQKNELLQRYLEKDRQERANRRWIRVATHSLIAVANFYSASQESSSDVRSVFYFLGGANAILALSASF